MAEAQSLSGQRRFNWLQWQWVALLALLAIIYGARLTALPVRGEESRWANGASDMIRLGDWIVPRQQGEVFVDRPPMSSWSMALPALLRGKVDLLAIRLPSVLSILAMALLIYAYARTFLSSTGALVASLSFATAGQVLQLGRLGENESLYSLLLGGGLIGWHYFYRLRQIPWLAWCLGYSLAALAALQKGIQAPAYFGAAMGTYMLVCRDWRGLFSWGHLLGGLCFTAIVGGWWLLFYLATDWNTAVAMWSKTVAERFGSSGLLAHLATFPLETFTCLLPWSPLLAGLLWPGVRKAAGKAPDQIVFCAAALPLPYLSLLLASFARGRYFMPLYPLVAIVIGWIAQACVESGRETIARRGWGRFLVGMTAAVLGISLTLLAASLYPQGFLQELRQPIAYAVLLVAAAIATGAVLIWARRDLRPIAAQVAVLAIAAFLGLAYDGAMINIVQRVANDMTASVEEVKSDLPHPEKIVSLGPIYHRFAWYYGRHIPEHRWPIEADQLDPQVEYFCFDWCRGDTPQRRTQGRGLIWEHTPGTLPFEWEQIAFIPCDPHQTNRPKNGVIIGRVVRPRTAAAQRDRGSQAPPR